MCVRTVAKGLLKEQPERSLINLSRDWIETLVQADPFQKLAQENISMHIFKLRVFFSVKWRLAKT
jgi:hypothetical protein